MIHACPYCYHAQSMLLGNVFCSRDHKPMDSLDNGTFLIKTKRLEETEEHVSRLSIRCMLNGNQYYKVGSRDHLVYAENYLVLNQGQHYRTAFHSHEALEMLMVAFKPGFAESVLHATVTPEDKLLEDPFGRQSQPVLFFEQTYQHDKVISNLMKHLRRLMNEDISWRKETDLDGLYTALLIRLMEVHRNLNREINKLPSVRRSTKTELFRRLHIARDYMDANTDRRISIEEVARIAWLSPHHFKHSFKSLFGISPHRYHVQKRLDASTELLTQQIPVDEVCRLVGFENTSSFIRLFKEIYNATPGRFSRFSN